MSGLLRNSIKQVNDLQVRYQKLTTGYRKDLYVLLQEATIIAQLVNDVPAFAGRFLEKIGRPRSKDIIFAVVSVIMGETSSDDGKKSSRCALAIRFLLDEKKILPHEIARAIEKHGGIAHLSSLSAARRREVRQSAASEDFKVTNNRSDISHASNQIRLGEDTEDDDEVDEAIPRIEVPQRFHLRLGLHKPGTRILFKGKKTKNIAGRAVIQIDNVRIIKLGGGSE